MRRTALVVLGFALLSAGCSSEPVTTESRAAIRAAAPANDASALGLDSVAAVRRDIAALRAATVRLQRFDARHAAGYDTQFPEGCFASAEGGMGFHYMNAAAHALTVTEPQFVMYEPRKNGEMRLVGVEYIFPGLPTDPAPQLFGRSFTYNTTFKVWALHVWAWKENPRGIFADWNPRVSCRFAGTPVESHHH